MSVSSPIGRALLGKIDGDAVDIETPRGTKAYKILEFSTVHEASDLDD
ncbi:MAG: GreA/GreB family elongation factor [Acidobacteriota bacterium]|nr:GreA/GreB family elongation factor [Acidobacteriota bacterium]